MADSRKRPRDAADGSEPTARRVRFGGDGEGAASLASAGGGSRLATAAGASAASAAGHESVAPAATSAPQERDLAGLAVAARVAKRQRALGVASAGLGGDDADGVELVDAPASGRPGASGARGALDGHASDESDADVDAAALQSDDPLEAQAARNRARAKTRRLAVGSVQAAAAAGSAGGDGAVSDSSDDEDAGAAAAAGGAAAGGEDDEAAFDSADDDSDDDAGHGRAKGRSGHRRKPVKRVARLLGEEAAPSTGAPGMAAAAGAAAASAAGAAAGSAATGADAEDDDDDDAPAIVPFNLDAERRSGYFEENFNFVRTGADDEEEEEAAADPWLAQSGLVGDGSKKHRREQATATAAAAAAAQRAAAAAAATAAAAAGGSRSLLDCGKDLASLLRPGETVGSALARLAEATMPERQRLKRRRAAAAAQGGRRGAGSSAASSAAGGALDRWRQLSAAEVAAARDEATRISSAAGQLMQAGDQDVYDRTSEDVAAVAEALWRSSGGGPDAEEASAAAEAEAAEAAAEQTRAALAEPDARLWVYRPIVPPEAAAKPAPSSSSSSSSSSASSSSLPAVQGPFTSTQMLQWAQAGFFQPGAVECRRAYKQAVDAAATRKSVAADLDALLDDGDDDAAAPAAAGGAAAAESDSAAAAAGGAVAGSGSRAEAAVPVAADGSSGPGWRSSGPWQDASAVGFRQLAAQE